jgi:dynein heavy chain 1
VIRRRAEGFFSIKINPAHVKLQDRLDYLRVFRQSHEQLLTMTSAAEGFSGLGSEAPFEIILEEEVRLSYESVKNVDILDVSPGKFPEEDQMAQR